MHYHQSNSAHDEDKEDYREDELIHSTFNVSPPQARHHFREIKFVIEGLHIGVAWIM